MGMTIEKGSALERRLQQQARQPDPYAYRDQAKAMRQPVGGLENPQPQHREVQTLDRGPAKQKRGKKGVVQCVVCIVSYRSRLVDSDNLCAGAKPLRDLIAGQLGIDDGDGRIRFEYDQVETRGETGTQVLITML